MKTSRFASSVLRRGLGLALSGTYRAFLADLREPRRAQDRLLRRLTDRMSRTLYGQSRGLRAGDAYEEFAGKVPIVSYEDLEPWITRQAASHDPIITPDPIVVYEETSGSTGPRKLIPYTSGLLESFDRFFRLWACDLLTHGPRWQTGKTLFGVSLAQRAGRRTPSGVPIGLADDTHYLSPRTRRLFGSRFLPPPTGEGIEDIADFRRVLATRALAERDLEVIFIWSPSYLTSILDWIRDHRDRVIADLERGSVELDTTTLRVPVRRDLRPILVAGERIDWLAVWPLLKLVSCWTDASASLFTDRIEQELPGVWIQGKGLLATEAPITVPLCHSPAPVPLLSDVFLEFLTDFGDVRRLHQIQPGEEYEVIVSQRGGLARYRMNDRVRVTARHYGTPCLRFLGRNQRANEWP